jgi:hypothetical protein
MMCPVIDADTSDDARRAPQNDGGVLGNLPRTRPQRSSARRAAARSAAGVANGAGKSRSRRDPGDPPDAKRAGKTTAGGAGKSRTRATSKASRSGADGAKRRPSPSASARKARAPKDAAPRQGFEGDGETASGSVQPPGGAELVATAAEIVGELAKAGLSTGERLIKDFVSRLPLS